MKQNETKFVKDYHYYYRIAIRFHGRYLNLTVAYIATNALSFMNMRILTYSKKI